MYKKPQSETGNKRLKEPHKTRIMLLMILDFMAICNLYSSVGIKEVKVYTGSYQRAIRKGSRLVLTLARAPPSNRD